MNDNNRQELSHSQIKREYRRITGQKSIAKYLKIHGEQAAFILDFAQGQNTKQEIETILRKTDYQQLKQEKKKANYGEKPLLLYEILIKRLIKLNAVGVLQ